MSMPELVIAIITKSQRGVEAETGDPHCSQDCRIRFPV
jgi:hypothetical protein